MDSLVQAPIATHYSGYSGKAPGGWGFYLPFRAEASLNKNPTPVNFLNSRMKRIIAVVQKDLPGKPHEIKRKITRMFNGNGPEFAEST